LREDEALAGTSPQASGPIRRRQRAEPDHTLRQVSCSTSSNKRQIQRLGNDVLGTTADGVLAVFRRAARPICRLRGSAAYTPASPMLVIARSKRPRNNYGCIATDKVGIGVDGPSRPNKNERGKSHSIRRCRKDIETVAQQTDRDALRIYNCVASVVDRKRAGDGRLSSVHERVLGLKSRERRDDKKWLYTALLKPRPSNT
jgi:hypothetical protein